MKTKGLTFLEAVEALHSGKCEAIENENNTKYTINTTGLTLYRQDNSYLPIPLEIFLDSWSLIKPKPKTEFRELEYWIIVDDDGSITITRTGPTTEMCSTVQHVKKCSFGYIYTFPK